MLELGAGTGRLTALYASRASRVLCCDRSPHMLARARSRLGDVRAIEYRVLDNLAVASVDERFDVVLEGWSFGHTVGDRAGDLPACVDRLVDACAGTLTTGGVLLFLETLGTNAPAPAAPDGVLAEFYARLENTHGFTRSVLDTSYRFGSKAEARRVLGFFFGEALARSVDAERVAEFTGAWTRGKQAVPIVPSPDCADPTT